MVIVYLAEQQHPVRRQIALKVTKPGMDSKRVVARFPKSFFIIHVAIPVYSALYSENTDHRFFRLERKSERDQKKHINKCKTGD